MKLLLFISILAVMGCNPETDAPENAKRLYNMGVKFMEDSSEMPPEVQEQFNKFFKKDSLSS